LKIRAPLIKELHYTAEEIAEVERIKNTEPITKRKDQIRSVLGGPLCCVDSEIPAYRITYDLSGVIRIEAYCKNCFDNVYQKTKDVDISDIAEIYNCTIAPGAFGAPKK
jgi:hypothetical protein